MKSVIAMACALLSAVGCARMTVEGDSVVLAGDRPAKLMRGHVSDVRVRSTYLPGGTEYQEGKDYVVDRTPGTIARTQGSRIPDFTTNVLYGKEDFDHSKYPGYGNGKFFAFVDYATKETAPLAEGHDYSKQLRKTASLLKTGEPLKIVAYGDSITAGGEASTVDLQYPARYVSHLKSQYPKATVTWENGATGGDRTTEGLARLDEKVLKKKPDLVLLAFGMNDHNIGGFGTPLPQFEKNLRELVTRIREGTGADVILLSTFPPNPKWHFSSHSMDQYAAVTRRVAAETGCAYADVYGVWMKVLERKDPESLLGNNINHPNDFGHWIYLQALEAVKF